MSIGSTRISNVSIVNVAHEKKQEGCISKYKYERWTCQSTKTKITTCTVTWWWWGCVCNKCNWQICCQITCFAKHMLSYICSYVWCNPIINADRRNWRCQYTRRHAQHRKCSCFDKDEIAKRVGCNQEEETTGNTMYKKVQSSYRTRKILSFKASPILPMESWRWHNINIPKLSWLLHQQTAYHTSKCTQIQWKTVWHLT